MGVGAVHDGVQAARLEVALAAEFGGETRVVVRQATDLHDSGFYRADADAALTVEAVLEHLRDAPDDCEDVVDRWNWWVRSLALAYGDRYAQFTVRRPRRSEDRGR
jgi:hypothetical protein